MKRYDLDRYNWDDDPIEQPDGPYVLHEEVRASVERLLAVAESMPHATWKCTTQWGCQCPRRELIAGLKEMAK